MTLLGWDTSDRPDRMTVTIGIVLPDGTLKVEKILYGFEAQCYLLAHQEEADAILESERRSK